MALHTSCYGRGPGEASRGVVLVTVGNLQGADGRSACTITLKRIA